LKASEDYVNLAEGHYINDFGFRMLHLRILIRCKLTEHIYLTFKKLFAETSFIKNEGRN